MCGHKHYVASPAWIKAIEKMPKTQVIGGALGASALELESVAQPCKARSDEASTVMDANEIYLCFIFIFLLFMTWFYERVRPPNLVSFGRNGYSRRLWFLPR
jgi:hypothetical protein